MRIREKNESVSITGRRGARGESALSMTFFAPGCETPRLRDPPAVVRCGGHPAVR